MVMTEIRNAGQNSSGRPRIEASLSLKKWIQSCPFPRITIEPNPPELETFAYHPNLGGPVFFFKTSQLRGTYLSFL